MGRTCLVRTCPNRKTPFHTVHKFPSIKNSFKRSIWASFVSNSYGGRLPTEKIEHYGVCSIHFTPDEYVVNEDGSKRLKPNATPKLEYNEVEEWQTLYLESQKKVEELVKKLTELETKLCKVTRELEQEKDYNKKYSQLFTENKQRLIRDPGLAHVRWTNEDVCKFLGLYSLSKPAYEFIKSKWGIPLPSHATLQRHLYKMEIEPGVPIQCVFQILKNQFSTVSSTDYKSQCVLALDEISISPSYCYDRSLDQVFGAESNINVISARGLFQDWKQPLMYSFNVNVSDILNIIQLLLQSGLEVAAITTDMGSKNQKLWKELNVGQSSGTTFISPCYFPHPVTQNSIFLFPDFPHLLKSLRNNFLDSGIILQPNVVIDKSVIIKILEIQEHYDLRPAHSLTYKHVSMKGQERQNLRSAFQLFSHTVATLIRSVLKDENNYEEIADFFDMINNLSGLMNTRFVKQSTNAFQCPYGSKLEEQNMLLDSAYVVLQGMKTSETQRSFSPFQKGLLISINSIKGLFQSLSERYPSLQYLLTAKLNQDFLENMFSQLRGFVRFEKNPTAVEFKYRIKRLILCWNQLEDACLDSTVLAGNERMELEGEAPATFHVRRAPMLSTSTEMEAEEFCKEAGKEFIAGYISKKFQDLHPEMSLEYSQEESRNLWISKISHGQLLEPSNGWLDLFRLFEQVFCAMHGENDIDKKKGVVKKLIDELCARFPDFPAEVIQQYSYLRIKIRIKHLNNRVSDLVFAWRS